ncbi:hypothetical protein KI688_001713 [Linnemannia hyalina]|uniref:Uncharacterized protein n=1 Tax=Linnemannia hyalina TaxID=64524 RepID=A0A9P7XSS4_9FUNG|nr:hypothetical protein KI688_001713 [Linnemannia hyalina]
MKLFDLVDHDEPRISKLIRDEYEGAKRSLLKSGCQPTIKDDTRLLVVHDETQLLGDALNGSFQSMSSSDDSSSKTADELILNNPKTACSIHTALQQTQAGPSASTFRRAVGRPPKSRQGQAPRASSARNAQREDHPLLATGGSWTHRSATDGVAPHATTTLSSSVTTLSKEKATDYQVRLNLHSQSLTHKVPVELEDSPELSPPPFFQPTAMIEESDDEERLVRNTRKNRSMQGLDYGSHALGDPVLPYNDICDFDPRCTL